MWREYFIDKYNIPYGIVGIYAIQYQKEIIYIGQSTNVLCRWKQHNYNVDKTLLGEVKSLTRYAQQKYNFLATKRPEDVDFIILQQCAIEELDKLEFYYIQKYKPRFNFQPGGK